LGVLKPTARLAVIPRSGLLWGALELHRCAGVPAADGVVASRNKGSWGGALGADSSTVPSPISTSSKSDDGKSIAGGEDMVS
jgi:hypothetical protein